MDNVNHNLLNQKQKHDISSHYTHKTEEIEPDIIQFKIWFKIGNTVYNSYIDLCQDEIYDYGYKYLLAQKYPTMYKAVCLNWNYEGI